MQHCCDNNPTFTQNETSIQKHPLISYFFSRISNSLSHALSHTPRQTLTNTHFHSLALSQTHAHTRTRTHKLTHTVFYVHVPPNTQSLFLALSATHSLSSSVLVVFLLRRCVAISISLLWHEKPTVALLHAHDVFRAHPSLCLRALAAQGISLT